MYNEFKYIINDGSGDQYLVLPFRESPPGARGLDGTSEIPSASKTTRLRNIAPGEAFCRKGAGATDISQPMRPHSAVKAGGTTTTPRPAGEGVF